MRNNKTQRKRNKQKKTNKMNLKSLKNIYTNRGRSYSSCSMDHLNG